MTRDQIVTEAVASSTNPKKRHLIIGIGVMFVLSLIAVAFGAVYVYKSLERSAVEGADLAQQVQAACNDNISNTDDLADLCDQADTVVENAPSAVVQGTPGADGEDGEDGRDGQDGDDGEPGLPPTDVQIEAAVIRYCEEGLCNGEDGQSATASDVEAAVALYCNANGECRGPGGSDGSTGSTGATGAQGPPASAEQIAAAVVNYCGTRNECRGPVGPTGNTGSAGPPGRGIASIACSTLGMTTFQITYSDGTIEEIECTSEPIFPDPEPTDPAPSEGVTP